MMLLFVQELSGKDKEAVESYEKLLRRMTAYLSIPRDKMPHDFTCGKVAMLEAYLKQTMDVFRQCRQTRSSEQDYTDDNGQIIDDEVTSKPKTKDDMGS